MAEIFTPAFWGEYGGILAEGVWDTLLMTGLSTLLAYLIGLPMGVVMILTQSHGIRPNRAVNAVLGWVINIGRSLPFIILMIALFPFTKLVVGTKIGIKGAVVPLVVSAAPFIARMVETALSEVDAGVIEAAQAMGCSTLQVVWKVLLPESLPSLLSGFTTAFVTILGYGAMSGFIGGGGLGSMSLQYAWNNRKMVVLYGAVIVLVILVQIFQSAGSHLAVRMDRRVTNRRGARKKQGEREKEIPPGAV